MMTKYNTLFTKPFTLSNKFTPLKMRGNVNQNLTTVCSQKVI